MCTVLSVVPGFQRGFAKHEWLYLLFCLSPTLAHVMNIVHYVSPGSVPVCHHQSALVPVVADLREESTLCLCFKSGSVLSPWLCKGVEQWLLATGQSQ